MKTGHSQGNNAHIEKNTGEILVVQRQKGSKSNCEVGKTRWSDSPGGGGSVKGDR